MFRSHASQVRALVAAVDRPTLDEPQVPLEVQEEVARRHLAAGPGGGSDALAEPETL